MSQTKQIKLSSLVIASLLLIIVGMVIFGWMYYTQLNPVDVMKSTLSFQYQEPKYLYSIYGNGINALKKPMYVVTQNNKIFVSDSGNNRVEVFDYNGKFIMQIGKPGLKKGEFSKPTGITIANDQLYVADLMAGNISVFNMDGKFVKYFAAGLVKRPNDLVYKNDKIYVTDFDQMQVKVFDLRGKLIRAFGSSGNKAGQFYFPNGLAVNDSGNIYVSDSNNNRIQVFNSNGKLLYYTTPPADASSRNNKTNYIIPRGISLDKVGRIFMANTLGNIITVSNSKGEKIGYFGFASEKENDGLLVPQSTYIDSRNRLYVADTGDNRIVVYELQ